MTRSAALLGLTLAAALALRVIGLGWGLPTADRFYPYHPDEPLVAAAAWEIDFARLQIKPRFYNYGSLPLYLDRLAVDGAAAAGLIDLTPRGPGALSQLLRAVIVAGRWLTVLFGVLTVWVTAILGRRLYGSAAGGLAALLLALAPLHLAHGHYATVDVPAAWWTTLCLFCCAGVLQKPGRGALAAAGACAGLAASTKYNAGLVLLAPLYTLVVTWRRKEWYASDRAAALLYAPLAAVAAFLLTTPGIFLDSAKFWHDVLYEVWHSGSGHGKVFLGTPPAWLYHLSLSLPQGLGLPLSLAVVAGVVWAIARHRAEDGLLLSFIAPYYLLIGSAEVKFSRYLLPMVPALVLLAARVLMELFRTPDEDDPAQARKTEGTSAALQTPAPVRGGGGLWLRGAAVALVALCTAAYGLAMAEVFARDDPRDQAAAWLAQRGGQRDGVALLGEPWFYTPPLTPQLGCTHALAGICGGGVPPQLLAPRPGREALTPGELDQSQPRYVVASEFEYADSTRLRSAPGYSDPTLVLLDHLRGSYRLARTFRNRPALGPARWLWNVTPVQDLLYPMPDVRVYERISSSGH